VTQAAQRAFDEIWAVPHKRRADFLRSRLRGLLLLVSLGALFIVSTLATGLVIGGLGHGELVKIAGIASSVALNVCLFFAAFRLMTNRDISSRALLPGVVIASLLWTVMQALGGYYIGHVLKRAHGAYGQFGFVIALLIWLHLGAQITLFAAEVNTVLARKLWPRSLFGPPDEPADQAALRALAKIEERSEGEKIDVKFHS
jgi:YihY family inner membrane protein